MVYPSLRSPDNTMDTSSSGRWRRNGRGSSLVSTLLRRHESQLGSEQLSKDVCIIDTDSRKPKILREQDYHLPTDKASPSPTVSLSSLPEDLTTSEDSLIPKSCLRYKTQIASLQRVYTKSLNIDDKRTVGFGSVHIHSHGICLGDNPAVSNGPPVTMEWLAFDSVTVDTVQEYEASRVAAPRVGPEMAMPSQLREDMILRSGTSSRAEMAQVLRTIGRIRTSRQVVAHRYQMRGEWQQMFANVLGKNKNK